ncbi:hypothetical protein PULV_a4053 [Pseudoalteromonas ulvae UL12]|uniref:hypothetical protein n=1 Tax=Pseudoalteromonas ulvae TaxID=107327 RepID=UPI00186B9351|nr:hypothetical protein [Pseudoalteromonas ulvae]MBE0362236.1 hypothetical protein [Pseudoalteromonas ulvae UL12]
MKTLKQAVECLTSFGNAVDFKGLKKLYKKAALLVHSDRAKEHGCSYNMVDLNNAWGMISNNVESALMLIEGSEVLEKARVFANSWKDDPLHEASVPSFYTVETMAKKAWNIVEDGEDGNFVWFNPSKHVTYIKDSNLEYRYYYGGDVISFYDLENSFKTGKECTGFRVCHDRLTDRSFMEIWSEILNEYCETPTPKGVWTWLTSLEMVDNGRYHGKCAEIKVGDSSVRVYEDNVSGNKNFSPFVINRVKPVASMPKKWTVVQLRKILANGQFSKYKQDYYMTDDYAGDAASNFRKGYYQNPLDSYADILTCNHMRVWSNQNEDGTVVLHLGAHSNDGRSLIVDLNNRYPIVDMEAEEAQYLTGDIKLIDAA